MKSRSLLAPATPFTAALLLLIGLVSTGVVCSRRAGRAFLALVASILISVSAFAAPADYRFELVQASSAGPGKTTVVKLRLVHIPDGKAVSGAIITQTKFDMGPEGMADMSGPAKTTAATEPGVYQIEIQPSMAGKWALTLSARVQGEPETVRGTVAVSVPK